MQGLFLALALAAISPASETAQIDAAEKALKSASSDRMEKTALALAGPRAHREKGALVLVLDDGKPLRFSDTGCAHAEAGCPTYRLAAVLPSHGVFVVWKVYEDGYDFLLIETANGKQHQIDGPPHYSPDGSRFVTCRVDEMNGGGTAIWRIAPGRYVREWQDERMSECGSWKSDAEVAVGIYDDVPTGKPHPVTVVHAGERWQLRQGADMLKARP
jgi:hypothetical protein